MTKLFISSRIGVALFLTTPIVFLSAFTGINSLVVNKYAKQTATSVCDTLPQKSPKVQVEKDVQIKINTDAVENAIREVEKSMNKLKLELHSINLHEPVVRINKKLDDVNWRLMNDVSQKALTQAQEQLNLARLKNQFNIQNNMNWDDVKRNMELSKLALQHNKRELQMAFNIARDKQFNRAKINLFQLDARWEKLKEFKEDLEKEGLIKKGKPYTIEIKEGILYIDGDKQSKKISRRYKDKYPSYFEEDSRFKISNDGNEQPVVSDDEII